ncbi:iron complex transport system ATP-binding protein [Tamilnaduibacter salinus]|uniref:Iron complex transport system ATP-binding protein n=1 Tax=Tamilnaduibacter salinus TaxID=1484056 RepID=A0A2U1CXY0_9GAMM|nr:ABC transporter ATP-binding protein [Tamilnaduibacter salinus]PVY76976.1 iron complex transport system ATP-binding protein [Tamilnaduibacter salinus]
MTIPEMTLTALNVGRRQPLFSEPLSLSTSGGEIWAVLGENGIGKSTLLLTLAGLLPPLAGSVRLGDRVLHRARRRLVAREVGLLLQQPNLDFPFTVREAVGAGRFAHHSGWGAISAADRQAIDAALSDCDLIRLQDQPVDRLSGGEQHRVALATLFAQSPRVCLFDEPVNHLDLRHRARLMSRMRLLARDENRLIIMAVHDINMAARLADRVLLLYPGGGHDHGEARDMLTASRLQRVYDHPLRSVEWHGERLWVPELNHWS